MNVTTVRNLVERAGIRTRPPTSASAIRQLEKRGQIQLPDDYIKFITQIANGGLSPCRLVPLEYWFACHWIDDVTPELSLRAPCKISPEIASLQSEWIRAAGGPDWEASFDAGTWDPMFGTIAVCEIGCGLCYSMIANGPYTGRVFSYGDSTDNPPRFVEQLTFGDWITAELDRCARGEPVHHLNGRSPERPTRR